MSEMIWEPFELSRRARVQNHLESHGVMDGTTDHWTSFQDLDRVSDHGQKIEHVLHTGNFSFLCSTAVQLRHALPATERGSIPQPPASPLYCSINLSRFATGHENLVLSLHFSDSTRWLARIRLPSESSSPDAIETSMLSEIATMRLVAAETSIPVPHIYGFDVTATTANQFGFRYLLMQALPGHIMNAVLSRSVPSHQINKVASQLADYYHQLSRLRFDRIGRLWAGPQSADAEISIIPAAQCTRAFHTSLEHFHTLRRAQTRSILTDHADDRHWTTAAWILELALPSMVLDQHIHGPFPLCHVDLHYGNILFDDDFNITGIIDWSGAQTVPLERFLVSPEFATFPGLGPEENAGTVAWRDEFKMALRGRELGARGEGGVGGGGGEGGDGIWTSPALISDLLGTPLWEIVHRCTYSFHWRALSDARLVLRQVFGDAARWEDFVAFHRDGPVHRIASLLTSEMASSAR